MSAGRHDELPVLPEEATDLTVHVKQCALRYSALLRYHKEISKRLRRSETVAWVYRIFMVPAVVAIIVELWAIAKALGLQSAVGP